MDDHSGEPRLPETLLEARQPAGRAGTMSRHQKSYADTAERGEVDRGQHRYQRGLGRADLTGSGYDPAPEVWPYDGKHEQDHDRADHGEVEKHAAVQWSESLVTPLSHLFVFPGRKGPRDVL